MIVGYRHFMPKLGGPSALRLGSFWVESGYGAHSTITAEQAAAIADAWRAIEQAILERTHGPQEVW